MSRKRWAGEPYTAKIAVEIPKRTAALLHRVFKTKKAANDKVKRWLLQEGDANVMGGLDVDLEARIAHSEREKYRRQIEGVPVDVLKELLEEMEP